MNDYWDDPAEEADIFPCPKCQELRALYDTLEEKEEALCLPGPPEDCEEL
jgi:hypothetical protein